MRKRLPQYIVGIPSVRVCYEGDSKTMAWVSWALHRRSGAVAFDRLSWIIDPSYWLSGVVPDADFFSPVTDSNERTSL